MSVALGLGKVGEVPHSNPPKDDVDVVLVSGNLDCNIGGTNRS